MTSMITEFILELYKLGGPLLLLAMFGWLGTALVGYVFWTRTKHYDSVVKHKEKVINDQLHTFEKSLNNLSEVFEKQTLRWEVNIKDSHEVTIELVKDSTEMLTKVAERINNLQSLMIQIVGKNDTK